MDGDSKGRDRYRCTLAWASILLILAPSASWAASLQSQERTVSAAAFYFVDGIRSDTDFDAQVAPDFGPFSGAGVAAAGMGDLANGISEASQDTDVGLRAGLLEASGAGSAGMVFDVFDPETESSASASSESFFEVQLVVDEISEYSLVVVFEVQLIELRRLTGSVLATGYAAAHFELRGESRGIVHELDLEDVEADGRLLQDSITAEGVLLPDTYVLTVSASAGGEGITNALGEAVAGYGLGFTVVPEPSRLGCGMASLFGLAALSRVRRSSEQNRSKS